MGLIITNNDYYYGFWYGLLCIKSLIIVYNVFSMVITSDDMVLIYHISYWWFNGYNECETYIWYGDPAINWDVFLAKGEMFMGAMVIPSKFKNCGSYGEIHPQLLEQPQVMDIGGDVMIIMMFLICVQSKLHVCGKRFCLQSLRHLSGHIELQYIPNLQ